MVYSGPQKYPPASTAYWYQDTYGGLRMEVNVVVWHTTEGMTLPSYGGGASAPNITAKPDFANKRLRWYQHFDIDRSSRALVDSPGGASTNRGNAVQVELIGTCDPATMNRWISQGRRQNVDFIFWPQAPDWALAEVAKFVTWLHENHGVQIKSTVTWRAYPSSYGNSPVRMSVSQWNAYYGHLGHQHVPENDHGDPGNINFARIIEHALGAGADVALTVEDVRTIFNTDGIIESPNEGDENTHWALASFVRNTYIEARQAKIDIAALRADVGRLTWAYKNLDVDPRDMHQKLDDVAAKVESLSVGGVDLDALAEKVADLLAARLVD